MKEDRMAILTKYDEVDVEIADQAEIDAAVQRQLDRLGITRADLEAMAETEDFTSEHARRLWFFIAPLDGLV